MQEIGLQTRFWNDWNASAREHAVHDVSLRQAEVVTGWLDSLEIRDAAILEAGCGSGWFCNQLSRYGSVTATDLSDEVLARASRRMPHIRFVPGDFMHLDFGAEKFDVVVTLEVLSHVEEQAAFVRKLADHLRPGGYLMMATQNRYVLENFNNVPPPATGQIRRWVDKGELRNLLENNFVVTELFTVSPKANKGLMRVVNSSRLNEPIRFLFGNRVERLKERLGFGWTIMALARK
ncbi:class I SAM-dependent methyltransferase [Rhizobium sp. YS-1r]|uniref:class I SAM-dependent methyltransferase n=1 Tax=Rhizobium sp. YS-1r TaxID=1532558 RepID=UPI00050DE460|nr:class I SAM-dependent methyltransferase [Rhizobium sp. YS-1r]KGD99188.1 3-demethylubiquinone-9 3-methyltransferase [Rhizobium sp. YS-1r]